MGAGKTSLVNTLNKYIQNPTDNPESVLSEDNEDLIETKVLQIYDDITLKNMRLCVKVEENMHPKLVSFREAVEGYLDPRNSKRQSLKIMDLGGHTQYYSCASLFVAGNAVFNICINTKKLESTKVEDLYFACVGSYIEIILQSAYNAGIHPKIVLMATQGEDAGKYTAAYKKLLSMATKHLASQPMPVYLLDEVIITSSKEATKESLEDAYAKITALVTDEAVRKDKGAAIPRSWWKLLEAIRESPMVTIEQVKKKWSEIKEQPDGHDSLSSDDMNSLQALKRVLEHMNEQKKQKAAETLKKKKEISAEAKKDHQDDKIASTKTRTDQKSHVEPGKKEAIATLPEDEEMGEEEDNILSFLAAVGEILFYKKNPKLKNFVVTQPMALVNSLRTIINHTTVDKFSGVANATKKKNLLNKGLISFKDFETLHEADSSRSFTAKETASFLTELGLACPLQGNQGDLLLVPCLIENGQEKKALESKKEMEQSEESMAIRYSFDRTNSSIDVYFKILRVLTRGFVWGERGGDIRFAFSQKIEDRELGMVGCIEGELKWHTEGIQEPHNFRFLISEFEEEESPGMRYAMLRSIQVHIQGPENQMEAVHEILMKMDTMFSMDLNIPVMRSLACKPCQKEGSAGSFDLSDKMLLDQPDIRRCSEEKHKVDPKVAKVMEGNTERKPFQLEALMEKEKEALGLETFQNSEIREKIVNNTLPHGEQIWIYHDRSTDPLNLVAATNKYSHCVVYVGPTIEEGNIVHYVVHVKITMGVSKATIAKEDIMDVIKPNQLVFLGHRLERFQFAGNMRDKIVDRALACVDPAKPAIVFDYDHK